jgi:hypothetical protein
VVEEQVALFETLTDSPSAAGRTPPVESLDETGEVIPFSRRRAQESDT